MHFHCLELKGGLVAKGLGGLRVEDVQPEDVTSVWHLNTKSSTLETSGEDVYRLEVYDVKDEDIVQFVP